MTFYVFSVDYDNKLGSITLDYSSIVNAYRVIRNPFKYNIFFEERPCLHE